MLDIVNTPAFQASLARLQQLNNQANGGQGITCVRGIITTIKQGDLVGALRWYCLDADKLRKYPKLQKYMKEFLGDPYSDEFDQYLTELESRSTNQPT